MALLAIPLLTCIACSDPDAEFTIPGTEEPVTPADNPNKDWTATEDMKTVILAADEKVLIYTDYSRRFFLQNFMNNPAIMAEIRENSQNWTNDWLHITAEDKVQFGIYSVGTVAKLTDISTKPNYEITKWKTDSYYKKRYPSQGTYISSEGAAHGTGTTRYSLFKPKNGYVACYTTEEGVMKYIRIFAAGYGTNDNDDVTTITLQYQLF